MKKIVYNLLIISLLFGGGILVTYKLYNKIQRLENAFVDYRDNAPSKKLVYSMYEAFLLDI